MYQIYSFDDLYFKKGFHKVDLQDGITSWRL